MSTRHKGNIHEIYFSTILFVFMLSILLFSSLASAAGTQSIVGAIGEDFTATFNQSLSVDTNEYGSIDITVPENIGMMRANYTFLGAYDSRGKARVIQGKDGILTLKFNEIEKGMQDMNARFAMKPAFNTPVFVGYDLTMFTDESFLKSPSVVMSYPSSLEFIGSMPRSTKNYPVQIAYPESAYAGPISLNYLKTPFPPGYVRKDVGIFTLVGMSEEVSILERLVENLTFVPSLYTDLVGEFSLDRIWIITADLSGQGDFFTEAGGYARSPNMILMDNAMIKRVAQKQYFELDMQTMLVHEIAHLVTLKKVFGGQQKSTPWFDEGIAVFFELYSADMYLNPKGYWIEDGQVMQSTYNRYTREELQERYRGEFYFDVPRESEQVSDFYKHSAVVFYNFYLLTGEDGMRRLFNELSSLQPSGDSCTRCDTQKILKIMEEISGKSEQDILFPHKNNPDFENTAVSLVRKEITSEQASQILADDFTNSPQGQSLVRLLRITFITIGLLFIAGIVVLIIWLRERRNKKR